MLDEIKVSKDKPASKVDTGCNRSFVIFVLFNVFDVFF